MEAAASLAVGTKIEMISFRLEVGAEASARPSRNGSHSRGCFGCYV